MKWIYKSFDVTQNGKIVAEIDEEHLIENSKDWLEFISSLKPCLICGVIAGKHLSGDCEEEENHV